MGKDFCCHCHFDVWLQVFVDPAIEVNCGRNKLAYSIPNPQPFLSCFSVQERVKANTSFLRIPFSWGFSCDLSATKKRHSFNTWEPERVKEVQHRKEIRYSEKQGLTPLALTWWSFSNEETEKWKLTLFMLFCTLLFRFNFSWKSFPVDWDCSNSSFLSNYVEFHDPRVLCNLFSPAPLDRKCFFPMGH